MKIVPNKGLKALLTSNITSSLFKEGIYLKPTRATKQGKEIALNLTREFHLPNKPTLKFELVKDWEPGNYSVHFKTDKGALTKSEKKLLFLMVADAVPEGGLLSTHGNITMGGRHGLGRFGLLGFIKVGERTVQDRAGNAIRIPIWAKTEQNWTPRSWFGLRDPYHLTYTTKEIKELQSRIPEYLNIELQAKQQGWWLQMPNGSKWEGDPRSWILLMSKDGLKMVPLLHYAGTPYYMERAILFPNYKGNAWTGNSPEAVMEYTFSKNGKTPELLTKDLYLAKRQHILDMFKDFPNPEDSAKYMLQRLEADWKFSQGDPMAGGFIYKITYPKNAKVNTINANGNNWAMIDGNNLKTDEFVFNSQNQGFDIAKIFNVRDSHGVPYMDDVIIGAGVPRKSLVGGTGGFDLSNSFIYAKKGGKLNGKTNI